MKGDGNPPSYQHLCKIRIHFLILQFNGATLCRPIELRCQSGSAAKPGNAQLSAFSFCIFWYMSIISVRTVTL